MAFFETEKTCKDCGKQFIPYQYNQVRCEVCIPKVQKKYKGRQSVICKGCGDSFYKSSPQQYYCTRECRADNEILLREYNITRKDWLVLYNKQNGVCSICGGTGFLMKPTKYTEYTLCVDHDHNTGIIRGLLCNNCNRALGLLQDSVQTLENAINYLKESATTMVKTSTPKQVEAQSKGKCKQPLMI